MKRFLVLDSFRGLCALAVVMHHSHALRSFTELAFFKNANYLVEFFFVLSGFVLYHTYAKRLGSVEQLRRFVITRTCRLYPLHVVMLAVFIGFEVLKVVVERYGMSFNAPSFTGARAPDEIVPNLLLIQSWWPSFNALSFNYPSWSISVEYYLYLIFGLIALALPTQARKVFAAIAVLAFLALYFKSTLVTDNALKGLGCFFAGGVTYRVYAKLQSLHLSPLLASALEVLVLGVIYLIMIYSVTPQDILLSLLFCVAIWVFAFEAGWVSTLLRKSLFTWLGMLSFSIYMTHAAVIFAMSIGVMIVAKLTHLPLLIDVPSEIVGVVIRYIDTGSMALDNLLMVIEVAAVLAISVLSYRHIELRGIALGKRWSKDRLAAVILAPRLRE
jgi:peptidoglycan/LPS O-acetylase OafA/YrhL